MSREFHNNITHVIRDYDRTPTENFLETPPMTSHTCSYVNPRIRVLTRRPGLPTGTTDLNQVVARLGADARAVKVDGRVSKAATRLAYPL